MMMTLTERIINGENVRKVIEGDNSYRKFRAHYIVSSERSERRSDEDHVEFYSNKILNVGDSFEMDGLIWYVDEVVSDPDRGIGESVYRSPVKLTDRDLDFAASNIVKYLKRRVDNPSVEDVIEEFRMLCDEYDDFWARGLRTREAEKEFLDDLLKRMAKYGFEGTVDCFEAKNIVGEPVDKYEQNLTYDGRKFYYNGKNVEKLAVEELESFIKYLDFNGIYKRWSLPKDTREVLLEIIWKTIPAKYHITVFCARGVVIHGTKQGNKFTYMYKDEKQVYDGSWYLGECIKEKETVILSKDAAPDNIRYSDISDDIGKRHNFGSPEKFNTTGKRIEYEDDLVRVYDKSGTEIYSGLEDYEPMKDEDWHFDKSLGAYRFGEYIKVCV